MDFVRKWQSGSSGRFMFLGLCLILFNRATLSCCQLGIVSVRVIVVRGLCRRRRKIYFNHAYKRAFAHWMPEANRLDVAYKTCTLRDWRQLRCVGWMTIS